MLNAAPPRSIAGFSQIAPSYPAVLCDVWGVVHNGVAPLQPGIDALETVLAGRLELDRLFAASRPVAVTKLVSASGGNIRDLFALAKATLRVALGEGLPVDAAAVDRVIEQYGATRRFMLDGAYKILLRVSRGENLSSIPEQEFAAFAMVMDQHLLLCYWNGDAWYDVHPLAQPALERDGAGG